MSQLLAAGPILNLNNVKIHVNIWKTEAVDESSDGLLNHVSQGLTRNIKLEWCPINMSWFKGGAMWSVSQNPQTLWEGRDYQMCYIYFVIPLSPLPKVLCF